MNTALVLDGQLKSALAAVRALGGAQVPVIVGATMDSAMALHSRFASETFTYPSPKFDQVTFVAEVRARALAIKDETGEKPVLYCFSDATHLSLARARAELAEVLLFPLPGASELERAFDKRATMELARAHDIPTIGRLSLEDRNSDIYPAVVKNAHSIIWRDGQAVSGSANFVFSPGELKARYDGIYEQTGEAPLIQPLVIGEEYGVEMLCQKGEVLLSFAHKRIRSLSPRGGAAVVKETATESPELELMYQYATTLMNALSWTGPAMVEFKLDEKSGVKLMEINGRFWGSLPLPQKAGVDFVGGYYALATAGDELAPTAPVHPLRTSHLLGDLKWLIGVLFNNDPLRPLLYPSRLSACRDFIFEGIKSYSDVFSWRDPLPALFEIIAILKK